jgi:hypothetical protein
MRNAAEMALAEFNSPDVQLIVKDDGGTAAGAQQAAQQALDEGSEIILGPLFALTVGPVGQLARSRNIPVIAFSTDANVATHGVYLLSFLPETDVDRIIGYATSQGKRAFAALVPDNAYGTVVEAAFKQVVARRGGRVVALERYPLDKAQMQAPVPSRPWCRRSPRLEWMSSVCSSLAPACGKTRRSFPMRRSTAPGTLDRNRPVFAISPPAIAAATARIPSAPRHSRMMPSRS